MLGPLVERVYAAAPDADSIASTLQINMGIDNIQGLVDLVVSWILYIAAILAFIYLIISGITYITAGGNAEQAKKGQQGIINAIIGIVVIVLAFVILQAAIGIAGDGQSIVN